MNAQATKTGLFVLAFISAVLNYAGFIQIIAPDDWWLKALCLLTAIGVWVCLYLFWRYAFTIIPHLRMQTKRLSGWLVILIGCAVIIALSTYWNVIAFTGKEVLRLASLDNVTRAESHYSTMLSKTGSYQKLVPQLESLSSSAFSLADSEELNGALTGSRGKGGVSEALRQIGTKVASITASIRNVVQKSEGLKVKGQTCLSAMRKATEAGFSVEAASDLAKGADCLNGVMAELGQNDAAGSIAGVMQGLSASVVLPVSIRTDRQRQALDNVLKGLQAQANSIASFARTIPDAVITPFQIVRPNMASAVLQQWQGVIPAIATALAIDLLPLLLLILGVLLHRDGEETKKPQHLWTAAELADAYNQLEAIKAAKAQPLIINKAASKKKEEEDFEAFDDGEFEE